MSNLTLRCAVVGPVSSGKSTLFNAIAANLYEEYLLKQTTMVPTVYSEVTEGVVPDEPSSILAKNKEINRKYWESPELLQSMENLPYVEHTVPNFGKEFTFAMPLTFYDVPGLDDRNSESVYFKYLEKVGASMHMFVMVVDLFGDPFNKSGSRRILDKIVEIAQSHDRLVRLLIVVNKCDDMLLNEHDTLEFDDPEHKELFEQVTTVVNDSCEDVDNLDCTVVPLSAADAHVYRMMHYHPETKLPIKDINRIGLKEVGRSQWNRKSEDAKRQWFAEGLLDADYENRMKACGFNPFVKAFQNLAQPDIVKTWASDQFNDTLAELTETMGSESTDSLAAVLESLKLSFFPQISVAHNHLRRIIQEPTEELSLMMDDIYAKLEDMVALKQRLERDSHSNFAHSLGDEWDVFEAEVNVCMAQLTDLAKAYTPHESPFVSLLLKRLDIHVRQTLLERHLRILNDIWTSPLATDELPNVFRANIRALDSLGATSEQKNAPFNTYNYKDIMLSRRHHSSGTDIVKLWCDLAVLGIRPELLLEWSKAYLLYKNVYDANQWYGYDGRPMYHLALETRLGHMKTNHTTGLDTYLYALEVKTKWLNYRYSNSVEWNDDDTHVELPELDYVVQLHMNMNVDEEYAECEGWDIESGHPPTDEP